MIPERVHNFGTYFVTSQTWGRRALFNSDELAQLFLATLFRYRTQRKYLLHQFVVMPNHVHLIVTPVEITLERTMQFIKGGYSHAVTQTGRKSLEIWQKGFTDHRIRDAADYEHHRNYICENPVHAGLCGCAADYAYSSAHGGYQLDELPQRLKPGPSLAGERHG